jgi:putative acetyltransferase
MRGGVLPLSATARQADVSIGSLRHLPRTRTGSPAQLRADTCFPMGAPASAALPIMGKRHLMTGWQRGCSGVSKPGWLDSVVTTPWTTRPETADDVSAIREVNLAALPTAEEADLVEALRASDAWIEGLSIVTEDPEGTVVGHALLTCCHVDGAPALAFAPCAVQPHVQKTGPVRRRSAPLSRPPAPRARTSS